MNGAAKVTPAVSFCSYLSAHLAAPRASATQLNVSKGKDRHRSTGVIIEAVTTPTSLLIAHFFDCALLATEEMAADLCYTHHSWMDSVDFLKRIGAIIEEVRKASCFLPGEALYAACVC